MPIDIKIPITKEYILSKITQEQIFERYLGISPDVTRNYCNPLRHDPEPGCRFYYDDRGVLKFHDISQHWNWDCFNVVQHNGGGQQLNFIEALRKVADDFNISGVTNIIQQQIIKKAPVRLEILSVEWSKENLKFWNEVGILREDLYKYNVKPIKSFWINGIRYNVGRKENAYAYCFSGGKIKIYLPDRSFNRFYQNSSYLLQGFEQLPEQGEVLVWTKSYKDVISLSTFGIPAFAPQSENVLLREEDFINIYNRFDNIVCLYDHDWPGKKSLIKVKREYSSVVPLLFPKDLKKDWTDNYKEYGYQFMIDLIEDTKIKLNLAA